MKLLADWIRSRAAAHTYERTRSGYYSWKETVTGWSTVDLAATVGRNKDTLRRAMAGTEWKIGALTDVLHACGLRLEVVDDSTGERWTIGPGSGQRATICVQSSDAPAVNASKEQLAAERTRGRADALMVAVTSYTDAREVQLLAIDLALTPEALRLAEVPRGDILVFLQAGVWRKIGTLPAAEAQK